MRGHQRHRPDHAFRRGGLFDAVRGRSEELRPAAVHREEGTEEDGHLHSVRRRGRAVRDGRCEADDRRGAGAARRRVHRLGHRRVHHHRGAAQRATSKAGRARSRRSSFPSSIINLASGQVSIRFGAKGPNLATCTACTASAHAIGDSFEIIKRGAADAMITGGAEAAVCHMGVGGFARACARCRQRNDEPDAGQPPVRQGSRRLRARRRRRHARSSRSSRWRKRRGAHHLRRDGRLRHVRRRVPHDRAVGRRRRRGARDAGGARLAPASGPTRSITSTRTAPRRRTTIASRPRRSSAPSAITPTSWRSRRPSR